MPRFYGGTQIEKLEVWLPEEEHGHDRHRRRPSRVEPPELRRAAGRSRRHAARTRTAGAFADGARTRARSDRFGAARQLLCRAAVNRFLRERLSIDVPPDVLRDRTVPFRQHHPVVIGEEVELDAGVPGAGSQAAQADPTGSRCPACPRSRASAILMTIVERRAFRDFSSTTTSESWTPQMQIVERRIAVVGAVVIQSGGR